MVGLSTRVLESSRKAEEYSAAPDGGRFRLWGYELCKKLLKM